MRVCKKCNQEYEGKLPHCIQCVKDLLKEGLCKWCGKEPRAKKAGSRWSGYCLRCGQNAALAILSKMRSRYFYHKRNSGPF
jgi:hypothetical protein